MRIETPPVIGKKYIPFILMVWITVLPFRLWAQNIPLIESRIREVFALPDLKAASYGIILTDINTGKILFSDQGEKLLIPASSLKIATATLALRKAGGEKKLITRLGYEGTIDKNGTLNGNIRILGGGDPTLGSKEHSGTDAETILSRWVNKIKTAGIRKINGTVIGDASCFQTESEARDWLYEDIGNHYGAFATGLCLNENKYTLILSSPAGDNQLCEVRSYYPVVPGLNHTSFVRTSLAKGEDVWILGGPGQHDRKVIGTLPPGKGECTLKGALPDPPLAVAFRLKQALTAAGIEVSGNPQAEIRPSASKIPFKELDAFASPTLKSILEKMLLHSQNLFAENMICMMASEGKKEDGLKLLQSSWPSQSGTKHRNFLYDGSGLSPMNAVTPYSLAEASADWYAQVGKLGLKEKVPGVFVKSGYMERVRSYTGIIDKPGKPKMAFAFIVNHYRCGPPEMRRQMEKIMNAF
jgi:D-alanyl-D-alanine carboxypeptidase/D-alanyl-D-alanine-endopeptidase (penicillin-binding protein 4)